MHAPPSFKEGRGLRVPNVRCARRRALGADGVCCAAVAYAPPFCSEFSMDLRRSSMSGVAPIARRMFGGAIRRSVQDLQSSHRGS